MNIILASIKQKEKWLKKKNKFSNHSSQWFFVYLKIKEEEKEEGNEKLYSKKSPARKEEHNKDEYYVKF